MGKQRPVSGWLATSLCCQGCWVLFTRPVGKCQQGSASRRPGWFRSRGRGKLHSLQHAATLANVSFTRPVGNWLVGLVAGFCLAACLAGPRPRVCLRVRAAAGWVGLEHGRVAEGCSSIRAPNMICHGIVASSLGARLKRGRCWSRVPPTQSSLPRTVESSDEGRLQWLNHLLSTGRAESSDKGGGLPPGRGFRLSRPDDSF